MSFVVFVGEPVIVPESIQVTIDCGQLIDDVRNMTGMISSIIWTKNGRPIVNGSEVNVFLAPDNSTIFISDTLLGTPAQVGTDGAYECEVCSENSCNNTITNVTVCRKYSLTWPDHFISFVLG